MPSLLGVGSMLVCVYDPGTQEAKVGGLRESQPGLQSETLSQKQNK